MADRRCGTERRSYTERRADALEPKLQLADQMLYRLDQMLKQMKTAEGADSGRYWSARLETIIQDYKAGR